ncbi:hypothetical protein [Spiroplasma endosymbiont of Polydrusus formosus]
MRLQKLFKCRALSQPPLRTKTIAEKYLIDLKLVNEVHNILMYTDKY